MVNPIEIEGFRTPGHTIHDVTLRDCTLPQDASIRLALYDELTLQNIHSAAEYAEIPVWYELEQHPIC